MFSIITPTYNRAYTLNRVYSSLCSQKYTEFEWIIVDDGSTDNTEELVESWKKEKCSFKIIYHQLKQNNGKPNALNIGFNFCSKPITIIADSDDSFKSSTLSDLKHIWDTIEMTDNPDKIAAVWTLVEDENKLLVGDSFPYNFWQVNLSDRVLNNKFPVRGEKWHSWRTHVLQNHKMFHSDYSFISEGITWNSINRKYDILCINLIHRRYYSSEDGLMQKKKSRIKIEKQKFYNSYYQLKDLNNMDIIKYKYYHTYAFNYVKSILYYKKRDLSLSIDKKILCYFVSIFHLPTRLRWSIIHRK